MKRARDQTLGETQRGMRPRDHRVAGSMRRQRVVVCSSARDLDPNRRAPGPPPGRQWAVPHPEMINVIAPTRREAAAVVMGRRTQSGPWRRLCRQRSSRRVSRARACPTVSARPRFGGFAPRRSAQVSSNPSLFRVPLNPTSLSGTHWLLIAGVDLRRVDCIGHMSSRFDEQIAPYRSSVITGAIVAGIFQGS